MIVKERINYRFGFNFPVYVNRFPASESLSRGMALSLPLGNMLLLLTLTFTQIENKFILNSFSSCLFWALFLCRPIKGPLVSKFSRTFFFSSYSLSEMVGFGNKTLT